MPDIALGESIKWSDLLSVCNLVLADTSRYLELTLCGLVVRIFPGRLAAGFVQVDPPSGVHVKHFARFILSALKDLRDSDVSLLLTGAGDDLLCAIARADDLPSDPARVLWMPCELVRITDAAEPLMTFPEGEGPHVRLRRIVL